MIWAAETTGRHSQQARLKKKTGMLVFKVFKGLIRPVGAAGFNFYGIIEYINAGMGSELFPLATCHPENFRDFLLKRNI
jgi:hypothetical protein